jgi:beta-lactamase regulating signal transducer with metallopeptidase domain
MPLGETSLIEMAGAGAVWLIDLSIRVAAVLLLATVATTLLRRVAPRLRYVVWTTALLGVLVMPALTVVMPDWSIAALPQLRIAPVATPLPAARPDGASQIARQPDPSVATDDATSIQSEGIGSTSAAAVSAPPFRVPTWALWVVGVWLLGVLVATLRLIIALVGTLRVTRRAKPLGGSSWNDVVAELTLALRPARLVRWLQSDDIETPMTWGLRRPVILVPRDADGWDDERRRLVLLHELVHVTRHDWLVRVLAQLACAMHWFNPLAWMAARRLDIEREQACDDAIIAHGTRPSVYASHLLEIARLMKLRAAPAAAVLSMAHTCQLEGRVVSILNGKRGHARGGAALVPTGVLGVTVVLLLAAVEPGGHAAALATRDVPVGVDGLMVRWSDEDGQHLFETSGAVFFNREGTEVTSMGQDGVVRLESVEPQATRRLSITVDGTGAMRHDWTVGGQPAMFDEAALRWMRSMIARGLDRTGRPTISRYPAGPALRNAAVALGEVLEEIALHEQRQQEIEEEKAPLYAQADRIGTLLEPLDERRALLESELETLRARHDSSDLTAEARQQLSRDLAAQQVKLDEIDRAARPLLEELETVEGQLDPLIERWFAIEDQIERIDRDADPIFERCDGQVAAEIRAIIERGLDAIDLERASIGELVSDAELDAAVAAMMEGCCAYFYDPDDRQIVIQVSAQTVRQQLGTIIAEPTLSAADRRALDEAVERLARLVSTLRLNTKGH